MSGKIVKGVGMTDAAFSLFAALRYEKDALLAALSEGKLALDTPSVRAAVLREVLTERRRLLSCVEFMIKEGRVAALEEAAGFLRERLGLIARAERALGGVPESLPNNCCSQVAAIYLADGIAAAGAAAAAFADERPRLLAPPEPPIKLPPPGAGLPSLREASKAAALHASNETAFLQARELRRMATALQARP